MCIYIYRCDRVHFHMPDCFRSGEKDAKGTPFQVSLDFQEGSEDWCPKGSLHFQDWFTLRSAIFQWLPHVCQPLAPPFFKSATHLLDKVLCLLVSLKQHTLTM